MPNEWMQMLAQNIETAAAEARFAAIVLCGIAFCATLASLWGGMRMLHIAREENSDGWFMASMAPFVSAIIFVLFFLIELETALAPHAKIITNLVGGGK